MPPVRLESHSFPDLAAVEVEIEEQQGSETARHLFSSLPDIPERFPPSFGGADQREANMLYLGNRVREAYAARHREAVFREPYHHTTPTGARQPVSRVITIKIDYARLRASR